MRAWKLLGILAASLLALVGQWCLETTEARRAALAQRDRQRRQIAANRNRLRLGAASPYEALVSIPVEPPEEFDGLARAEVYARRRRAVSRYADLLAPPSYEPSEAVFGQIVDGKPWWGTHGLFVYWKGRRSIEGPSEEARFVLNPFLLVGCSFLNRPYGRQLEKLVAAGRDIETLPLYCEATGLTWNPRRRRGSVRYRLSAFLVQATQAVWMAWEAKHFHFDLSAYNARDLNLNYLHIPPKACPDVVFHRLWQDRPLSLNEFIHVGGSCGYPGGGNNASPYVPELQGTIQRLPQRIPCRLWHARPASVESDPDFLFEIVLE